MMNSGIDAFAAPPFWQNGPAPGQIYNFPSSQRKIYDFSQRSQAPVTTATSLMAIAFDGGVMMAGDILGSYGSLARYTNCKRIVEVNKFTCLGASGDYGDFQYVNDLIQQKVIAERVLDDKFQLSPKSLHCWLTRVMYNRRSKFDPFWNNFIVAGIENGEPYLGSVDKLGTAYTDKRVICTGFAAHLALPILRVELANNPITETAARSLIDKCMEICYYRDARSWPLFQRVVVLREEGIKIDDPTPVNQNWSVAHFVK